MLETLTKVTLARRGNLDGYLVVLSWSDVPVTSTKFQKFQSALDYASALARNAENITHLHFDI